MTVRPAYRVSRIALTATSGLLLILCFPNFEFSFLAWFAFIPLLFALQDVKPLRAFLLGYLTGLIFYLGSIYWLVHVTLPGYIILCFYLALYFGFFTLFAQSAIRNPQYAIFTIPAFWVSLEFIRTSFPTGFGWLLLGYSQYKDILFIQIADIAGVYGVSFLIIMVNIAIYQFIKNIANKTCTLTANRYPLTAILLLSLVVSYGYFRVTETPSGRRVKIAVIQGNISQEKKWDSAHKNNIFKQYSELTSEAYIKEAYKDKPDLIIWPETAFPAFFGEDKKLSIKMMRLAGRLRTPLLFGTPLIKGDPAEGDVSNSAILLNAEGDPIELHDKVHLVPFGEYVPLERFLKFIHEFAPYPIAGFVPGDIYTVFRLPERYDRMLEGRDRTFSVLICFEDIFPSISRRFVKDGASFLVNITNDAWFKESAAPYQHAQASVFRAVENRVNVVRAANTGLSCFIDTKGRITSRVNNKQGKDLFIAGYDTQVIRVEEKPTKYTEHGDIFVYCCMAFFILKVFLFAFTKKKSP